MYLTKFYTHAHVHWILNVIARTFCVQFLIYCYVALLSTYLYQCVQIHIHTVYLLMCAKWPSANTYEVEGCVDKIIILSFGDDPLRLTPTDSTTELWL